METTNTEATMFPLDTTLRAARMIEAGRLTLTFRSPTGQHITITAKARGTDESGKWVGTSLAEAKVVFVEVPNDGGWNDKVGKITRRAGFVADRNADPARVYCAEMMLRYVAGQSLPPSLEVFEADRCGKCGRQLTDPVSIERGIGPECYGAMTGSQHETKARPATEAERAAEQAIATAEVERIRKFNAESEARKASGHVDPTLRDNVHAVKYDSLDDAAADAEYQAREIAQDQAAEVEKIEYEERVNRVATDRQGVPMGVGDWRARQKFAKAARDADKADRAAKPCSQNKVFEATGDAIPY